MTNIHSRYFAMVWFIKNNDNAINTIESKNNLIGRLFKVLNDTRYL
jgi:hypothetical protein